MVQYRIEIKETILKIKSNKSVKRFTFICYDGFKLCGEIKFHLDTDVCDMFEDIVSEKILLKYFINNRTIYMSSLSIEDDYRNLGVANFLMEKFIEKFKHETISLLAVPFKYGSKEILPLDLLIKFYQKFNFKIIGYNFENPLMILKN